MQSSQTHLQVDVFTPMKTIARVDAKNLLVPGLNGYLEILPGHTPIIAELGPGLLRIDKSTDGQSLSFYVSGGYVETCGNKVVVLADAAEGVNEIDVARAEKSSQRAKERLTKFDADLDIDRALSAEKRAQARLDFVNLQGKS